MSEMHPVLTDLGRGQVLGSGKGQCSSRHAVTPVNVKARPCRGPGPRPPRPPHLLPHQCRPPAPGHLGGEGCGPSRGVEVLHCDGQELRDAELLGHDGCGAGAQGLRELRGCGRGARGALTSQLWAGRTALRGRRQGLRTLHPSRRPAPPPAAFSAHCPVTSGPGVPTPSPAPSSSRPRPALLSAPPRPLLGPAPSSSKPRPVLLSAPPRPRLGSAPWPPSAGLTAPPLASRHRPLSRPRPGLPEAPKAPRRAPGSALFLPAPWFSFLPSFPAPMASPLQPHHLPSPACLRVPLHPESPHLSLAPRTQLSASHSVRHRGSPSRLPRLPGLCG